MMDHEQEQRLPKYARDEIQRLRDKAGRLDRMLAETLGQGANLTSNVGIIDLMQSRPLPSDSRIKFSPEGLATPRNPHYQVYLESDRLMVMGSDPLSIGPRAANSIVLSLGWDT